MQTGYDPSIKDKFIIYYDIHSMYGTAMLSYLRRAAFKFLDPQALKDKFWELEADSSIGS